MQTRPSANLWTTGRRRARRTREAPAVPCRPAGEPAVGGEEWVMNRLRWVLGVVALLSLLMGACSSDDSGSSDGKISKLRVGLVTDVGKIDDKSFNQSAWDGVQQAKKDLSAEVKYVETTDPKDYAK